MTYILGLTGGIASGKSTVSAMFEEHGISVICADEMAHNLQQQGTEEYHKIIHVFGNSILSNNHISRHLLMEEIHKNPQKLKLLEDILHPTIQAEIKKEIIELEKHGSDIIVLDVPLLYTSPLKELCDGTVACICSESIRKKRAFERQNMSEKKWNFIIKRQPSDKIYKQWATYIINTELPLTEVNKEVLTIIGILKNQ